ncbi:MAG: ABC transporter ATP-binding protein [Lachnospiraceae bacterium]|nr:ABC transporter ATP-binding protein [Lachnospiraceae bacterium]
MGNVIEIKGLTKQYGKHRGVKEVSFAVGQGDMFAFLGPNGAGKSTTIRCMLGLIRYQEGSISLLDNRYPGQRETLRHIGYMPSEAMFYSGMKVKDVIRFAAEARGVNCDREAARLCEALEVPLQKKIEELSLGNRKKVSIVCAMQHEPELLILDEPTSGLDPLMQDVFFGLLQEANKKGTTCFLSSHVLSEVKKYCRNAAFIKEGNIVTVDSIDNLTRSNLRQVRIVRNGREERFSYEGNVQELLGKLQTMAVEDVLIEEPSLEEIFMHYYEEVQRSGDMEA